MKRLMNWNGNDWVHTDTSGEDVCDGEDCISLVDDYPGLSLNSFTWKREVWEALAEHIVREKARREEEANPKRWYVLFDPDAVPMITITESNRRKSLGWIKSYRYGVIFHVESDDREGATEKAKQFIMAWQELVA